MPTNILVHMVPHHIWATETTSSHLLYKTKMKIYSKLRFSLRQHRTSPIVVTCSLFSQYSSSRRRTIPVVGRSFLVENGDLFAWTRSVKSITYPPLRWPVTSFSERISVVLQLVPHFSIVRVVASFPPVIKVTTPLHVHGSGHAI